MRSRLITNLILLGIVIILVMVTLIELKPEKRPPSPISKIDTQSITQIELAQRNKPLIRFTRQKAGWQMLSPKEGTARQEKIEKLLAIAHANSSSHFPLDIEKADRFGLKTPAITLRLGDLLIMVGDIAPISQQRYLRIGDTLYLVTDNFYHHLIAQPEQYLANDSARPDSR